MVINKKNPRNAGRKPKLYEEEVILDLIYRCIQEMSIVGEVKYQFIYPYCLELYEKGVIDFKLSEDFWRKPDRQGTLLLKKVNLVVIDEVEINKNDIVTVVNTEDAINKLFEGKESKKTLLLNKLRLNEVRLQKYIQVNNKLDKKINKLEAALENKRNETREWKNKAEELQRQIFLLMEYSESKNFPIVNIINTGKTQDDSVTKQLKDIFGNNPVIGYEYDQYINTKKVNVNQENVIPMSKSKDKNKISAADDFGLL